MTKLVFVSVSHGSTFFSHKALLNNLLRHFRSLPGSNVLAMGVMRTGIPSRRFRLPQNHA
jgi:hypothetical protein